MFNMELSRSDYEKMVNLTPELLGISYMDGAFKYINPAYEKIFGYNIYEMMELNMFDLIHPEDKIELLNLLSLLDRKYNQELSFEYRYRCKNGNYKWIAWNIKIEWSQKLVYSSGKDITERRVMENELKINQERLYNTLSNADAVIFEIDKNGIVLLYEGKAINKTGHKPGEFVGQSIFDLYKDNESIANYIKMALDGENIKLEAEIGPFIFDVNYSPIMNQNGNINGGIVIAVDITDRKLNEGKLKESEQRYKGLAENVPVGIISYDNNGCITFINPKALEILGSPSKEQTMSINLFTFLPLIKYGISEVFKQCIESGNLVIAEKQYISKWGKASIARLQVAPIKNDKGETISAIAIMEDFSERKNLETELKIAKEQAEQSNKAKSQFLANMSHEIRTPMNGIMGMTDLLLYTDLCEEQKEMINVVKSSSKSLLEIIDDILELSKIEAGKVELKPDYIDVSNFINKITKVFGPIASNKNLTLITNLETSLPKEIFADEIRLMQIISNLLGNDIKFTNNGKIQLLVKKIKIINDKIQIMFLVSDTGIGIKEQDIPKLFNYFTQLDDSKTKKFQGTGLGLTISKNLVELMGGEICVESEYGRGSTFYFTCLVDSVNKETTKSNTEHVKVERESKRNLNILLVEDDYVSQLIINRLCKIKYWKVQIASNGKDALEILKDNHFDLILMDVQMAGISGYEVTKLIRENEIITGEHIPIIATTAYAMLKDKEAALNAGMDDYISKPIDLVELTRIIEAWTN